MKLLLDMNVPPGWVARLDEAGFETRHWSTVGVPSDPDVVVLAWAKANAFVLVTHDLDFSSILAATSDDAPSVVQLRGQDLFADREFHALVTALGRHADEIGRGALLSIDEEASRVRILPLPRA